MPASQTGVPPLQYSSVVVDASVWASRLMPQDGNHMASTQWLGRYTQAGGLLVAPAFLLVEVSVAIIRQTGLSAMGKSVTAQLNHVSALRLVQVDNLLIQAAADIAADLHLRAGDALYVAVADQLSIPLVSWDKQQLQRASVKVAAFTPDNFPV